MHKESVSKRSKVKENSNRLFSSDVLVPSSNLVRERWRHKRNARPPGLTHQPFVGGAIEDYCYA